MSSSGIIEKIRKFFAMESDELELDAMESMEIKSITRNASTFKEEPVKKPTMVAIPNTTASRKQEIVVFQPANFSEAPQIAEHIKARKMVIVNMKRTDKELAKRIIDFLSGINYAVDGRFQKITDSIFLFAPSHIEITMADGADIGNGDDPLFTK